MVIFSVCLCVCVYVFGSIGYPRVCVRRGDGSGRIGLRICGVMINDGDDTWGWFMGMVCTRRMKNVSLHGPQRRML